MADLLDVTGSCIAALLELEPRDRQRVMSALHAVLDLTDHDEAAPRKVTMELREEEPGLVSPHFACAPEDCPEPADPKESRRPISGQATKSPSRIKWETEIPKVLQRGKWMRPLEIARALGASTQDNTFRSALQFLARAGTIEGTGSTNKRAYTLPSIGAAR
jgi:hypothetical protein